MSEAQLGEYRRKLQLKLAKAERREWRMRAVTLGMAAVVLLGLWYFIIASLLWPRVYPFQHLFSLFPGTVGTIIGIVLWACYLTCAICVIPFLLLHFLQYRRKLQQTQQEQILATLLDLQRQIAELRERIPPNGK
ncbi:MAG: hypothetical protein ABSG53_21495 [Thermoguttaceae bacterium]